MSNLINISTILIKRGNTAAASAYVGPLGELLVDTGLQTLRLQDGSTPGGMSTLVNSQQLSNVIVAIEGIQSNTANISALVANIHGANISGLTSNVAALQHQLSANGTATIGGLTVGNIRFESNSYIWSAEDGQIQFSANGYNDQTGIFLNDQDVAVMYANTSVLLYTNQGGSGSPYWTFDQYGNLTLPGNVIFADTTVQSTAYQGPAGQTSFATVANVTTANVALKGYIDNKISLLANAPAILDTLGQIATAIQTDEANIGTLLTNLTTTNANVSGANAAIVTANTAMRGYVDAVTTAWTANAVTQLNQISAANTAIATLQSNVGSYYTWANANVTGLYTSILGANANVGVQQTAINNINANITTANATIASLQSNIGSYYVWANANVSGLYNSILGANSSIATVTANIGSFYTWANLNYGTSSYANANVTAYLVANPQAGTYSNTNVASYLAGNVTIGNVTSTYYTGNGSKLTNVTAQYLGASQVTGGYNSGTNAGYITLSAAGLIQSGSYALTLATPSSYPGSNNINISPGTGGNVVLQGNIVAAGNIFYGSSFAATANVTAPNFLYSNGVSILTGIGGTYSNSNVASYLLGNITTGNVGLSIGSWLDFRTTDQNWRIGYGLGAYTKTTAQATVDVVVGQGQAGPDGFTVGQTGGASIFELVGYTRNAWFANNVTTVGNVTSGNVLATGFFYANGTPFTSSSYGNAQVAAYLLANPPAGTYSNTNVGAYLTTATITTTGNITAGNLITSGTYTVANITTTGAYGNITGANVINANTISASNFVYSANGQSILSGIGGTYSNTNVAAYLTTQTFYSNSNVASYLIANPPAGTYSNTNVASYISATTFSAISSSVLNSVGQINGTLVYVQTNGSHNFLFDSSGNLILPIGGAINYANGQSILTGISASGTIYSNTNVAAYLTTQTFYSNSNVAAYLVANPQGGVYSNANVIANLQNLTTNVVTTANVQANYFIGNGSALSGLTYNNIGNIYGSSSNVTLQAGSYSWTFDTTGNLTIPTTSNIVYANGTVFTSGTGSGGAGTIYSNANVAAMLSANTAVFVGNTGVIGNVATGNIQANATAIFLGANTVISNYGSPTFGYASHIGNNVYFDANGVQRYRNTQTGASDLIVGPGTLYWYATGGAVTANTATGYTGASGAYMAISTSGMSLYNGAGITSAGAITIQNATGLVTNQATTGLFQNASTINAGTAAGLFVVGSSTTNVTVGSSTVQSGNSPLVLRATGVYNTVTSLNSAGGYGNQTYTGISVTGGSGTGMIVSVVGSTSGYLNSATVTNPGTGYKNGDAITIPASPGNGGSFVLQNYNSAAASGTGTANYTFSYDGNLTLPGNVLHATNSAIYGDFTNSTVNYRTIFRPTAANSNPGIYTAPTGTGSAASWQAANNSNLTNASKILIATNGTTDVQLVSGINGSGTYLPLSFLTNGTTQMQLDTGGNLNMVANGNITTAGNITAGNIIANHYGNSIGTTATYSGNVTASSVIASGSSGPQTRFLWDTWQANSTSALSSFTPSGTIGGNATWDSTQAYGLKLTTTTTTQSGYINWNSATINYNYDMVITASVGASGGTGADGQWIYFGSNAAITGNPGNTNTYGGIAVMNHYYSSASQFEVYVGGTQTNIPFIGNGNYVTSGVTLWNASYTSFYNLTLKIRKIQNGNRMLEVYLNEIYQGSVNIGSWTPVGNYFGVAAYTGGSTAQNWVRQLRIDW